MVYPNTQETSVYAAADLLPPLTSYRQLKGMIIVSAESCTKERELLLLGHPAVGEWE